jgi:5-formyltetrahydrofolate cyclo-ligase
LSIIRLDYLFISLILQPEMKKSDIRNIYKEKRLQLSLSQKEKMDDLMLIHFQKLVIDIPALIMTYSPIKKFNEFDPQAITDYCYFKNPEQQLLYPLLQKNTRDCEMSAVVVDDYTFFETNKLGIDEPIDGIDMIPSEIDMFILPLLAFDKKGNRVGYGKGCYDRFLKQCRKDCIKIGFSYFDAIDKIDDIDTFDIKLNYCITPKRSFTF